MKVSRFLPLEQLGKAAERRPDSARLAAVTLDENYIAVSQDAAWLSYSPTDRATVMVNKKVRLLRDYQVEAVRELQKAASPSPPSSTSSPREERVGRGPRRGATYQDAPPLPGPLLHPMEERENLTRPGPPHRFLFEMATGTGKTLLSAAIAKLYLRTENATRILFLVDRLELEN